MPKAKASDKQKLAVKIVLEITGHMPRVEVDRMLTALSSLAQGRRENGGNGG
jgi:hypothetical protein